MTLRGFLLDSQVPTTVVAAVRRLVPSCAIFHLASWNDGILLHAADEDILAADERLAEQARANDEEHYAVGFDDAFDDAVIDLVLRNQRLFAKLQDNPGFKRLVKEHIRPRVYGRQRAGG